jgi:hypothetical protein
MEDITTKITNNNGVRTATSPAKSVSNPTGAARVLSTLGRLHRGPPPGLDDDHLLDRWCFYCAKQFHLTEKFVICLKCHAFTACTACWITKDNAQGYFKSVLEARQQQLLEADAERKKPRWPGLEKHEFTMEHANSDAPDASMEYCVVDSSSWD